MFELDPYEEVNLKFPNEEELNNLKEQLSNLKKSYSSGDYLAKEKNNIEQTIKDLQIKINDQNEILKEKEQIEKNFNILRMDLYTIDICNTLRKKLGLEELKNLEFNIAYNRKDLLQIIYKCNKKQILDFTSIKRILEYVTENFLYTI